MASLEARTLGEQIRTVLSNQRSNMRTNAARYKAMLASGKWDLAKATQVIRADAAHFLRFIEAIRERDNDPARQAKLVDAINAVGLDPVELRAQLAELRSAAISFRDGAVNDAAGFDALMDGILSGVAAHDLLWEI